MSSKPAAHSRVKWPRLGGVEPKRSEVHSSIVPDDCHKTYEISRGHLSQIPGVHFEVDDPANKGC